MIDLLSITLKELHELIEEIGEKSYRADQIYKWLYDGADDFSKMTNVSKKIISGLSQNYFISKLSIELKLVSKLDGTVKYLFRLDDGNCIESVVMRYNHGLTICISTQVGCRMGCGFCASTIGGLVRSLSAGEIINQIIYAKKDLGERISNVVMMGIGEPFDNFDNTLTFLENATNPDGLNIGQRHISISTCGIAPKIRELADKNLQINLCISLHAPNNLMRDKIMPINHKYKIEELIEACKYYIKETNRRISFEYALIGGVNDTIKNADMLIRLLRGMLCHVNLIPVNSVAEREYKKGSKKSIEEFSDYLNAHGLTATIRRELGSDINASCGQLRKKHNDEENNQRGDKCEDRL